MSNNIPVTCSECGCAFLNSHFDFCTKVYGGGRLIPPIYPQSAGAIDEKKEERGQSTGSYRVTWEDFSRSSRGWLEASAKEKGYTDGNIEDFNWLFEFLNWAFGGGHPLGEIIYKAVRYNTKRNPDDLEKIAAWAFLLWRAHKEDNETP